jgi:hypothetical protein
MATAAPYVKLLRQLASAKDDYLSGAFDISWDGAKATLYLVFGRPSHAVFDTDQAQIEGEAAIDALLAELPRTFVVSDWRRAMSPQETLSITIDELAGPFVRLAGSYADDPVTDATPDWWSADDSSPDLAFGLADFPLLPGGRPLWTETSPEEVNLAERLAELPPSIVILTGAKLRAAAVVSGGDLIDAVWIDADDQARGEAAGMAILGATKGSLAGYALDDPRVAEALTMLWRLPLTIKGIEMAWLDPASMLAAFHADGLDRVLVIDAPVRGIALFSRGGLVAVYSETQRSAVASPERLRSLLSQARGRLTVMERKPRPLVADAIDALPSASEFFVVAPDEADDGVAVDAMREAEPGVAADAMHQAADGAAAVAEPEGGDNVPVFAGAPLDPAGEASAPVSPPLPPNAESTPDTEGPTPPAIEITTESEGTPKRPWWAFGRSRKNRTAPTPPPEGDAATPDANAATSFGWSVRQPGAEPPAVATEAASAEAEPPAPAAAWPVVEAETPDVPELEPPTVESEGDVDAAAALDPEAEADAAPEPVPADVPEAEAEVAPEPIPSDAPETATETAHDFWAEFTTPEPELDAEHAPPEPAGEPQTVAEAESDGADAEPSPETEPDHADARIPAEAEPDHAETQTPAEADPDRAEPQPALEDRREPDQKPVASEGTEPFKRRSSERTVAPWSWPLAEPESPAALGSGAGTPASTPRPTHAPVIAVVRSQPTTPDRDPGFDEGFFQRDEPIGSQFVDFDEVRKELIRIGVVWLGESNAVPVTALLAKTRSTIDDFVATIDVIRGLHLEGQDPSSIQAMAREMHQQAAERLCGA